MGKTTLVRPDGRVIEVDDADVGVLENAGYRKDTVEDFTARNKAAAVENHYSTAEQKYVTVQEGLESGFSMGLSDQAQRLFNPQAGYAEDMAGRRENNPITRGVSEFAGAVVGSVTGSGPAGWLDKGAAAVGQHVASRGARLAVEGAVYGVGGAVEQANVTGDPLTVESLVEGAGVGALFNFGVGKLGDRLVGVRDNVVAEKQAADKLRQEYEAATEAATRLKDPPPSWSEFHTSFTSAQKATKKANEEILAEVDAYTAAISDDGVRKAIKAFQGGRSEVQSRIAESAYGKGVASGKRAASKAEREYAGELKKIEGYINGKRYSQDLDGMQTAIEEIEERYGLGSAPRPKQRGESAEEYQARVLEWGLKATKAKGDGGLNIDYSKLTPEQVPGVFADEVEAAAQKAGGWTEGASSAYISDVYEHMNPAFMKALGEPSLDDFKQLLNGARQKGDIAATRADYIAAMDINKVKASEFNGDGFDMHLVKFGDQRAQGGRRGPEIPRQEPQVNTGGTVAQEMKEAREQLSRAAKMRAGGYDPGRANRWVKDPNAARDDLASLAELADLRKKLDKYTFVEKPDVPRVPTAPEGYVPPGIELSDAAELGRAAQQLDHAVSQARQLLREKKGDQAIAALRMAQGDVNAIPGLEDLVLPSLPAPSRAPLDYTPTKLPKSFREFARMRPDNPALQRLAAAADSNEELAAAIGRLAADLDLKAVNPGATPGETIRAIHATLNDHAAKVVKAERAEKVGKETAKKSGGLLGWLRDKSQEGLAYSAARGVDTGGWKGAILRPAARSVVGGAAGYLMGGTEGAVLGSTLGAAKLGMRGKVRNLIAKLVDSKASKIAKARPATAYLAASWLTGEDDPEPDSRKQAVNRIDEVLRAQYTMNDALFSAVEDLAGAPGDIAYKVFAQAQRAIQHLADTAPRDPGIDVTPAGSNWTPDHTSKVQYAHRIEAVVDPWAAIERVIQGDGSHAATETLWTVWPALMQEIAGELVMASMSPGSLAITYERGSALSQLFRVALTGLQDQRVVTALQGLYLPKDPQPQGGAGKAGPAGRPPAVDTQVAGSSVAGLIH